MFRKIHRYVYIYTTTKTIQIKVTCKFQDTLIDTH